MLNDRIRASGGMTERELQAIVAADGRILTVEARDLSPK